MKKALLTFICLVAPGLLGLIGALSLYCDLSFLDFGWLSDFLYFTIFLAIYPWMYIIWVYVFSIMGLVLFFRHKPCHFLVPLFAFLISPGFVFLCDTVILPLPRTMRFSPISPLSPSRFSTHYHFS